MIGSITASLRNDRGKSKTYNEQQSSTSGSETISAGTYDTQATLELLDQVLQNFNLNAVINNSFQVGQEQAQGAVGQIFQQYRENDLPQILGKQGSTGAYGSTAAQLLTNDAFARASTQAAELGLGVGTNIINSQLAERQNMLQQFAQLLQANLQQNVKRNYNESSSSRGSSINQTRGMSYALSASGGTSPTPAPTMSGISM